MLDVIRARGETGIDRAAPACFSCLVEASRTYLGQPALPTVRSIGEGVLTSETCSSTSESGHDRRFGGSGSRVIVHVDPACRAARGVLCCHGAGSVPRFYPGPGRGRRVVAGATV